MTDFASRAPGRPACEVTVLIPTLNRPALCERAIRSVLEQLGVEPQVLISENGSDASFGSAYDELFGALPRSVRVLRHPKRMPVEQHIPLLIGLVETTYVVLLADDDQLTPTFVARALDAVQASPAGAVFGRYCLDHQSAGTSPTRDIDYTAESGVRRALKFIVKRDDGFIYGMHRTQILKASMTHFKPFQIFRQPTLMNIAYAPLVASLCAAPYLHLRGEPVLRYMVDSVKTESYLGEGRLRKLIELIGCEWVLVGRYMCIASVHGGRGAAWVIGPVAATMACWHSGRYLMLALRRLALIALASARRA